ncbi:MAG: hypothetical protein QXJ07_05405 [Candidatus Bathyarchaeia archaeon]
MVVLANMLEEVEEKEKTRGKFYCSVCGCEIGEEGMRILMECVGATS